MLAPSLLILFLLAATSHASAAAAAAPPAHLVEFRVSANLADDEHHLGAPETTAGDSAASSGSGAEEEEGRGAVLSRVSEHLSLLSLRLVESSELKEVLQPERAGAGRWKKLEMGEDMVGNETATDISKFRGRVESLREHYERVLEDISDAADLVDESGYAELTLQEMGEVLSECQMELATMQEEQSMLEGEENSLEDQVASNENNLDKMLLIAGDRLNLSSVARNTLVKSVTAMEPVANSIGKIRSLNKKVMATLEKKSMQWVPELAADDFFSGLVMYMVILPPTIFIFWVLVKIANRAHKILLTHVLAVLHVYWAFLSLVFFLVSAFTRRNVLFAIQARSEPVLDFIVLSHACGFGALCVLHSLEIMSVRAAPSALLQVVAMLSFGYHAYWNIVRPTVMDEMLTVGKWVYLGYFFVFSTAAAQRILSWRKVSVHGVLQGGRTMLRSWTSRRDNEVVEHLGADEKSV